MKTLFFSLLFVNLSLSAYEKIDFIGQATDNSIQTSVSASPFGDKIYALSKSGIVVYDSSYTFSSRMDFKLEAPGGISAGNGLIYALDSSLSKISVYNEKGEFVFSFGSKGSKNGQLSSPADLRYFADGKIYVANTGLNRVEVFDRNGIYLYGFNTVKTDGLTKVKPKKIFLDRSGFIYVSDPGAGVLQKYDRTGKLIAEKNYRADSIAVNDYGIVYVANEKEGKIRELDRNLNAISTFGTKGKGKFEFLSFSDLDVVAGSRIMVMDSKNKKIMLLELENNLYPEKLPEFKLIDRIRLAPKNLFRLAAFSFGVISDDSIVYYGQKEKKAYFVGKDSKKDFLIYGEAEGQVKDPLNMVFSGGKIYVCDTGNSRAQIFGANGKYESYFGGKAGFMEKNKEGKFSSPSAIAVDTKGKVYVADTGNDMVQAFNKDGIFLFTIGPGISNFKMLKVTDVKTDEDNNLYIMDSELKKIIVTDSNGKYLNSWNMSGVEKPVSFDYDWSGYFYVLDRETSNIRIFDRKGAYLTSFFAKGKGDRELYEPNALKIFNGTMYVSDPGGNKLAAFAISYVPDAPTALAVRASEAKVELSWQSPNPKVVKEYRVFRGETPSVLDRLDSTKKLGYSDAALKPETTYYYKVAAVSPSGEINPGEVAAVYFKGREKKIDLPAVETEEDIKNKPPVEIVPVELNYVFSANYKYYMNNPLGSIQVKNNTGEKFSNIKVSFFLRDYMDFPSDAILPGLEPKASAPVELMATLNNRILTINEDTPVQAQLTLAYYRDGKENSFTLNKPIRILSKNAITWDNTERIANFITVKDTPVVAFSRNILTQKGKYENKTSLDESLLVSVLIWENLNAYGITYLADPVNPYSTVKSSGEFITDTVQFPRNTLKLKSGDCDDLTALLATLLESAGIRALVLDYPGHIALMFETGAHEISEVGLPDDYIVRHENKYFIPVETTLLGKNIHEAIIYAANMYRNSGGEVKVVDLRTAMSKFEPVTLPDTSDEFKYGTEELSGKINKALEYLADLKFKYYEKLYLDTVKADPQDVNARLNLGILYAENGKLEKGMSVFEEIVSLEDYNASALNNIGNVHFMGGEYQKAIDSYMKAAKLDPYDENIFLNLARAYVKAGKKEDARVFAERAVKINPGAKGAAAGIMK